MIKKAIPDGKIPNRDTATKPKSIRFSEIQLEQLEKAAKQRNLDCSAYIRSKLFEDKSQVVIIEEGAELMRLLANTYNAVQDLTVTMRGKITNNAEIKAQLNTVLSKQVTIITGFNDITANISFIINSIDEIKDRSIIDKDEEMDSTDYVEDAETKEDEGNGNS